MKFLFSIIEVILHIILLFAPFTIYFTSPIVDVIRSHEISTHGLAKRLVIFSAGGVRENTFYQNLSSIVFLNKLIIEGKAMFGVGETHVPTDTRANYVALTSGLYENIIRMTFKTTPLSVDTIFDRAKKSVIFGNKNIVKLFEKNENIKVFSYIPDKKMFQNYENSTKWVFEKVKEFYKNEPFLMEENKIITFINLESTDIIGHVFKPTSKEYVNMLIEVDKNIFEMYQMIENIYPDKSTSYIFTSDHGMTDLGKHGGGSDHETQVPFVAWGAGIQPSRRKQRIKQIDIPSFLSSLIGTAIPKNNLGILPQHLLRSSPTYKYQASCGNLKQMVEQYLLQREQVYNHTLSIFFKEDSEFTQKTLSSLTKEVTRLAENRRYDTAAAMCLNMIPRVKKAILYFHTYDKNFLIYCLTTTFILSLIMIHEFIGRYSNYNNIEYQDLIPKPVFQIFLLLIISFDIFLGKPLSYLLYHTTPVYFLSIFNNIFSINSYIQYIFKIPLKAAKSYLYHVFISFTTKIIFLALFILSFYDRRFLSIILLFLSSFPFLHNNKTYPYNFIWSGSCLLLSLFPFLPHISQYPSNLMSFFTYFFASLTFIYYFKYINQKQYQLKKIISCTLIIFPFILLLSHYIESKILTSLLILMLFLFIIAFPFMSILNLSDKLVVSYTGLFLSYSVLSISYELVFLLLFIITLYCYVRLEHAAYFDSEFLNIQLISIPSPDDIIFGRFSTQEYQRAYIAMSLILVAFFDMQSISSLILCNVDTIPSFFKTFSPTIIYLLLIIKKIIPLLIVAIAFSGTLSRKAGTLYRFSVLIMIISDTIAFFMFFYLKDEGTLSEVGVALSNYIISITLSLFVYILLNIANFFMLSDCPNLRIFFNLQDPNIIEKNKETV